VNDQILNTLNAIQGSMDSIRAEVSRLRSDMHDSFSAQDANLAAMRGEVSNLHGTVWRHTIIIYAAGGVIAIAATIGVGMAVL
jgi:hypothetical protein